ncbi:MAG: hypothetical protein H7Z14_00480 [Anaerolineae bacterium]|nr:hypothetical protein [Phycisphaerae bacterium]
MKCDLCDSPSTVHLTEIHNGIKSESHLCDAHADQRIPGHGSPEAPAKVADCYRRTIAFMTEHGRTPTSDEADQLELALTSAASGDALDEMLRWLQEMVTYIDEHGRMPGSGELDER